jgi:hypothetical protein
MVVIIKSRLSLCNNCHASFGVADSAPIADKNYLFVAAFSKLSVKNFSSSQLACWVKL